MFRRPTTVALVLLPTLLAPAYAGAATTKVKTRSCASTVQRPRLATDQGPVTVLRAATNIKARRISCTKARTLIGDQILQVASLPGLYPDTQSWWTKKGYRVTRVSDPTRYSGGPFAVQRVGGIRIRFTLWY